jgi:hypothetical protein
MWHDPQAPQGSAPLVVFFKEQAQRNDVVSTREGYDCFDNVLIAEVQPGAQAKSSVCIEIERKLPDGTVMVNKYNYNKYKVVVDDFKNGSQGLGVGTPLHFLPGMDAGRIASLKAQGVHWIESLAEMPESSAGELMGFYKLKQEARKFIDLREKNAPLVKMEETEKRLTAENERLQRQINELIARFGDEPKRGPGRPKKEAEAA